MREAITFSDTPWDFWEEMQRYRQFEFLRNAVLRQSLNWRMLVKPSGEYWSRKRYVLDHYEHYVEAEKKYRTAFRKEERVRHVMEQMAQKYVE